MVGITLSPEQIHSAPPEVRRWLEHEIATSLGLQPERPAVEQPSEHLVACTPAEAAAVYAAIQGMLPVVNVFFELGREGASIGREDIRALRLAEILRHTRLAGMEQLAACLRLIDEALRRLRGDPNATLYVVDRRGYCLVATATEQSILAVWQQVIAGQQLEAAAPTEAAGDEAATPHARLGYAPAVSWTAPASAGPGPGSANGAAAPAPGAFGES